MRTTAVESAQVEMGERFGAVRRRTLALCAGLTAEDMMVQSCPEASPAKWHLAHTAWVFESFVLGAFSPAYKLFNADFPWLFNSYYASFAQFPEKRLRSSFSRPGLEEVLKYREHVDEAVGRLLERGAEPEALRRIELGLNHEEQHQELLLTDILNAFFTNPLRPVYAGDSGDESHVSNARHGAPGMKMEFVEFAGGLREVGHGGDGFCFDNELPRHRVWLEPSALGRRLVTCGEYAEFIADGGYDRTELWLSAGWDTMKGQGWRAPLYWTKTDGAWSAFTLRGERPLEDLEATPVSHMSFYEADAYARWAGRRLATEFEWEAAGEGTAIGGNLLDSGMLTPCAAAGAGHFDGAFEAGGMPSHPSRKSKDAARMGHPECLPGDGLSQLYGDCWEWTGSAYLGYPGFQPLGGTLGEYNGKFMSGQMVLRGGSCVTPQRHIRASYRNFFAPETRWQFSGIRLAAR